MLWWLFGGFLALSLTLLLFFRSGSAPKPPPKADERTRLLVLYGSTTGTSRLLAAQLSQEATALSALGMPISVEVKNVSDVDPEDLGSSSAELFVLLLSTWTGGQPPVSAEVFCKSLGEMSKDFRVGSAFLKGKKAAVFGLGSCHYEENFCLAAAKAAQHLQDLGAELLFPVQKGDDSVGVELGFRGFCERLWTALRKDASATARTAEPALTAPQGRLPLKEYRRKKRRERAEKKLREAREQQEQRLAQATAEDNYNAHLCEEDESEDEAKPKTASLLDMEDLGQSMAPKATEMKDDARAEMVTPLQRQSLVKEGYNIIGSHSAVKVCRWTKNQMRGRGGCYKHTFYGITSYQCMEMTPSLACANKCVFCWRHHKNPVGREWRWQVDDPHEIVASAVERHRGMIKQLKGVPGVIPERYEDAYNVRHCALSLVGEPIMYPHINELVDDLHSRRISTFLVTNAQFPEQMANLGPVTQLYVSIDAATPESLKEVDRPLFKDFWQRFVDSLSALRSKKIRTVYRLTLVKSYNMQEVLDYCSLLEIGRPDLIEIKAVTYCGKSDASNLTMEHVPWHQEVVSFASDIASESSLDYELVCEHEHSCCVLLARKKFNVDGRWHTWIDYPRYFELFERFQRTGEEFGSEDYMAETPAWALVGSEERGFSPNENRWRRNRRTQTPKSE